MYDNVIPKRRGASARVALAGEARARTSEEGQTLVEYGLLIGLLAIVIIISLLYLGPIISQLFQNVGTTLA